MAQAKPLPSITAKDMARFWSKVAVSDPDACWDWQGTRFSNGYGAFKVRGRMLKAHRLAYFLATSADPGNNLVCHTCDHPPCCNPSHVFVCNSADNVRDRDEKGRTGRPIGHRAWGCRLTEESVQAIRAMYETGRYQQAEIAKQFGVSRRTISAVVTGTNWKHVPVLQARRRRVSNYFKA